MICLHLSLFFAIDILGPFVSRVSGHAHFVYPTPRNPYCANSSCTITGALGAQGPLWRLTANSSLDDVSPTTQTTCNGSILIAPALLGRTYDPGFQGTTAASWQTGSSQTLQLFVSQSHPIENQTIYPTDGWQIRYRDGTQSGSTFSPIAFTYVNVSTVASMGPMPGGGFQVGQIIFATITVPSNATSDGVFQFYWRNSELISGTMWLSCFDVTITALGTISTPSTCLIMLITLLTAVSTI
jgi:hypothetical protein